MFVVDIFTLESTSKPTRLCPGQVLWWTPAPGHRTMVLVGYMYM